MKEILKSDLLKIITPLIVMIFCGLCYELYAQQNTIIDHIGEELQGKVDNTTLMQMIKVLELKDNTQDRRLDRQEKILEKHSQIQADQLEVLLKIQLELQQLNRGD